MTFHYSQLPQQLPRLNFISRFDRDTGYDAIKLTVYIRHLPGCRAPGRIPPARSPAHAHHPAPACGVHPKKVQYRLGHATYQMTMDIYSHVTPDMQDGIAELFTTFRQK